LEYASQTSHRHNSYLALNGNRRSRRKGKAMTENNKPEWFEITDADEKPELRKVSKSLPVSAVLVAALILGVGAVTAQTQAVLPLSA